MTTSGTGLMGFGGVLAVVGAILRFALFTTTTHGFDVQTVGVILLIAGIVIFVAGLLVVAAGTRRRRTAIREDYRRTPEGQIRSQEREDW